MPTRGSGRRASRPRCRGTMATARRASAGSGDRDEAQGRGLRVPGRLPLRWRMQRGRVRSVLRRLRGLAMPTASQEAMLALVRLEPHQAAGIRSQLDLSNTEVGNPVILSDTALQAACARVMDL